MSVIWLQSSIWSNRFKTLILIILFPVLVFGLIFLVVYFWWLYNMNFKNISVITEDLQDDTLDFQSLSNQQIELTNQIISLKQIEWGINDAQVKQQINNLQLQLDQINEKISIYMNSLDPTKPSNDIPKEIPKKDIPVDLIKESFLFSLNIFKFLWPVILVWALISFMFYRQIIFAFTDAKAITRKENPEIYNIVENLCISRWLPTPNIWILEDDSLNAFAVGWNPKKAWIVFSRWIINKLNKQEIEAVAAHELTHIINKDWLLLVTVIVFIWAVAAIWEIMFRSARYMWWSKNSNSKWNQLQLFFILLWLALLFLWYMVLPLVQLAVSRKREYLADAGSVELTKDKYSMITALQNISQDSTIESIKKDSISALCIESPFPKAKWFMSHFHEFFSTHPSIENRVAMLEKY
ncbi:MAG: hypothetical protein ACD_4C00092G0002 [uncultured bacterium (gcode 4)]|uniref:Peptidase M48 domain-containing protein n=1 Tax=uncultured bacterium (gcode 4) TaxID=1234023 RepID=K2F758_9BACT|nr:MAG: hypothetical protein ACD_4C00092G0002 [uncultured bacterium (gcode 4)]